MKLQTLVITCGGKLGCGHAFEFREGDTMEMARKVLAEHRAQPDHMQQALAEANTERLLRGEYALTMNEFSRRLGVQERI